MFVNMYNKDIITYLYQHNKDMFEDETFVMFQLQTSQPAII